jgi:hypothetical protein
MSEALLDRCGLAGGGIGAGLGLLDFRKEPGTRWAGGGGAEPRKGPGCPPGGGLWTLWRS